MPNELESMLRDIALGKIGQQKSITQVLNSAGDTYRTERNITDAVPDVELIKELLDNQIGGEKDWC